MHKRRGFTIVELLIVIVVIGVLAAITVVAFSSLQTKSIDASIRTDLANAAKQMELAKVNDATGLYPSSLPSEVRTSNGNVLQLTSTSDPAFYCINAHSKNGRVMSYHSKDSVKPYLCDGATIGSPAGGTTPAVPQNVNLVADFSAWTTVSSMTYDSNANEMVCASGTGYAQSPLVRVNGANGTRITVESYRTTAATNFSPNGGVHTNSYYYADDGTTPAQNSAVPSYTGNGNAQAAALNTWANYSWAVSTGSQVIYVRYRIQCSPTTYTSAGQRFRNPSIMTQ